MGEMINVEIGKQIPFARFRRAMLPEPIALGFRHGIVAIGVFLHQKRLLASRGLLHAKAPRAQRAWAARVRAGRRPNRGCGAR